MNRKFAQKVVFGHAMALALATTACSPQKQDLASNGISTSVVVTSSSKTQGVADHRPGLMKLLMRTARAFVPSGLQDSTAAPITLDQAWIALKEMKFKMAEAPGAGEVDDVKFVGPYFVDLLSNTPPAIDTQSLAEGSYRRIEFKLHAASGALPAGVPAELNNRSIFVRGHVNGHLFTFVSDDGAEIRIAGPKGLTLDGNSDILISIRLAEILGQIDLSAVNADMEISPSNRVTATHPCPALDASSTDLYTCFRKGLEKEAKVGKDSDHNHEIEATEDEVHETL